MVDSKLLGLTLTSALAWCTGARAADFYVSVDGADANPGTLEQPFQSVKRAEQAAAPGDTVYIRGGVYRFSGSASAVGLSLTKSGASERPIRYFAYRDETPIFDLFELKPEERITGLDVRCNWVHVRGLEVRGVRQVIVGDSWGVRVRGDHNVIERLNVHDNQAPGIFIASGTANLVLNCDSHHNYDPLEQGGNADGFGCHSTGGDNILRGCRAWDNSDDGFDFINAPGTCIAESSWAFRNGFVPDTDMAVGNGAGFKAGGFGNPPNVPASGVPRHVVRKSIAFGNRSQGFYANHHPGGIDFLNNTAFDNPSNYDMRVTGGTSTHKLRNNIAAGSGRAIVNFNGGSDEVNSWTLPVQVSAADFSSLDQLLAVMPRHADGSLPDLTLARLTPDSDLIDRGEDVGLPFSGKAPDLGARELGESAPIASSDAGAGVTPTSSDAGSRAPGGQDAASRPMQSDASTSKPGAVTRDAGAASTRDSGAMGLPVDDDSSPDDDSLPDDPEQEAKARARSGCQLGATSSRVPACSFALLAAALALSSRRRRNRR
jgi:hypothetical protein